MIRNLGSLALVSVMACGLILSGCGTTPGDRGLSGGLLGAGTGAAIGAMAGSAGTGALIGGLGGAAIGMLTTSDTLNLGKPAWKQSSSHRARSSKVARNDESCTVRDTPTRRVTTCTREK
jgi:osmotically inducible lipoprotein OsmB